MLGDAEKALAAEFDRLHDVGVDLAAYRVRAETADATQQVVVLAGEWPLGRKGLNRFRGRVVLQP